jgi:hypothetical protein
MRLWEKFSELVSVFKEAPQKLHIIFSLELGRLKILKPLARVQNV